MTTRFLYLTDTHWGALPDTGYTVQPRDPAKFEMIFQAIKQWIAEQDLPLDFVFHGGDVVNDGTESQIIEASQKLATLSPRVLIGLGNHDLEQHDSMASWRKYHCGMLPNDSGTYVQSFPDFHLYVINHHWFSVDPPHFWNRELPQVALLDDKQRDDFEAFAASADRPIILAIHSPTQNIPASQTGDVERHNPDPAWREYFLNAIDRFPALQLILTAHAHVNTLRHEKQCVVAGTSAIFETPYEAKLITVDDDRIDLKTFSFGELLDIAGDYNHEKSFAQGRKEHRDANWPVKR